MGALAARPHGLVAAAKALAMTALDLLARPEQLAKAKDEFARAR